MRTVLVTGATGFVGGLVVAALRARGLTARAALRRPGTLADPGVETRLVGEVGPDTDWDGALQGVDGVVHLAARVHVLRERAADPLAEFRRVNAAGTAQLAARAAAAGVRRLVFVSTIKVNGEATGERPFGEDDPPAPEDAYGVSKWEAEQALWRVAREAGLEAVVIRPPLVYGPGVGGNLRRLLRVLDAGWPLPFGAVANRRSLIGVWNLADLVVTALEHPGAAGETFLAADGEDLSTPELLRRLAAALGRPARLLPVPVRVLRLLGRLVGRRAEVERLCGSLRVDAGKARERLAWTPPVPVDEGLARTARWYREREGGRR